MSALQRLLYRHMQTKGIMLTDGSEKDKKVRPLAPLPPPPQKKGGGIIRDAVFPTFVGIPTF